MSRAAVGDEVGEKPALFVSAEMDDVEVWAVGGGTAVVFSTSAPDRNQNQDAAAVVRVDDDTALLAVADGVGGERGGARASELAVATLAAVVTHTTPTQAPKALVNDAGYVTWVVGRNARVLSAQPWRLFDAEPCAPVERALSLGEPAITLGAVGILPWLLTRDPIHTFNLTLLVGACCLLADLC